MANRTIPLFTKHGIQPVGFWTEEIGEKANHRLLYILAYPSLADRENMWEAFLKDPELRQLVEETEKDGPWVIRCENRILRPTAYSPLE